MSNRRLAQGLKILGGGLILAGFLTVADRSVALQTSFEQPAFDGSGTKLNKTAPTVLNTSGITSSQLGSTSSTKQLSVTPSTLTPPPQLSSSTLTTTPTSNPLGGTFGNIQNMTMQNASAVYSAMPTTSTLTQIVLNKVNMSLTAGVYDLSNFVLYHSTLTLNGPGTFVFNINSAFALNSASVLLAGGATEANVLFNYTGSLHPAVLAGGTGGPAPGGQGESVLHGILLALNSSVYLAPGLVVGEVISGKNINISGGGLIVGLPTVGAPTNPGAVTTVADTGSTLTLSCLAFATLGLFYIRRSYPL